MIAEYLVNRESNSSIGTDISAERPVGRYPYFLRSYPSVIFDEEIAQGIPQGGRLFKEQIIKKPEKPALDRMVALDQFVSSLSGLFDMLEPLPPPIYQKPYKITEVAHDFIRKQKKSFALNESLDKVSNRILEFMRAQAIKSEIIIDLEVDPEYGDWIEPKIQVLIELSKFEDAYELFGELLDFSLKGIRRKETKRFMITIDTM